jgi:hypothetical protein
MAGTPIAEAREPAPPKLFGQQLVKEVRVSKPGAGVGPFLLHLRVSRSTQAAERSSSAHHVP